MTKTRWKKHTAGVTDPMACITKPVPLFQDSRALYLSLRFSIRNSHGRKKDDPCREDHPLFLSGSVVLHFALIT